MLVAASFCWFTCSVAEDCGALKSQQRIAVGALAIVMMTSWLIKYASLPLVSPAEKWGDLSMATLPAC